MPLPLKILLASLLALVLLAVGAEVLALHRLAPTAASRPDPVVVRKLPAVAQPYKSVRRLPHRHPHGQPHS